MPHHPILADFVASDAYANDQVYRIQVTKPDALDFAQHVFQMKACNERFPTIWTNAKDDDLIDLNICTFMGEEYTELIVAAEFKYGEKILMRRVWSEEHFCPSVYVSYTLHAHMIA